MSRKPKVFRDIPNQLCLIDEDELLKEHVLRTYNEEICAGDLLVSKNVKIAGMYPKMANQMHGKGGMLPLSLTCLHVNAFEWFSELIDFWSEWSDFHIELSPTDGGIQAYCGKLEKDWKKVSLYFEMGRLSIVRVTFSDLRGHHGGFEVSNGPRLPKSQLLYGIENNRVEKVDEVRSTIYRTFELFLYPEVTMLFGYMGSGKRIAIQSLMEEHRHGVVQQFPYLSDEIFCVVDAVETVFRFDINHLEEPLIIGDTVIETKCDSCWSVHGQWEVLKYAHKKALPGNNDVINVLYVSPYDVRLDTATNNVDDRILMASGTHFGEMRRKYRHDEIVKIATALHFLDTPYIVLEIVDHLPLLSYASRREKVGIIENVMKSVRKILRH